MSLTGRITFLKPSMGNEGTIEPSIKRVDELDYRISKSLVQTMNTYWEGQDVTFNCKMISKGTNHKLFPYAVDIKPQIAQPSSSNVPVISGSQQTFFNQQQASTSNYQPSSFDPTASLERQHAAVICLDDYNRPYWRLVSDASVRVPCPDDLISQFREAVQSGSRAWVFFSPSAYDNRYTMEFRSWQSGREYERKDQIRYALKKAVVTSV